MGGSSGGNVGPGPGWVGSAASGSKRPRSAGVCSGCCSRSTDIHLRLLLGCFWEVLLQGRSAFEGRGPAWPLRVRRKSCLLSLHRASSLGKSRVLPAVFLQFGTLRPWKRIWGGEKDSPEVSPGALTPHTHTHLLSLELLDCVHPSRSTPPIVQNKKLRPQKGEDSQVTAGGADHTGVMVAGVSLWTVHCGRPGA